MDELRVEDVGFRALYAERLKIASLFGVKWLVGKCEAKNKECAHVCRIFLVKQRFRSLQVD